MRFLFECVGRWSVNSRDPPAAAAAETRLLVSKVPPPPRRRRRSINATSEWKPTLFAISEDNAIVVAPATVDRRNSRLPVDVKRCGPTSDNNKVNATRVNNPDLSRDPGPIIIPSAFAAAPFMF